VKKEVILLVDNSVTEGGAEVRKGPRSDNARLGFQEAEGARYREGVPGSEAASGERDGEGAAEPENAGTEGFLARNLPAAEGEGGQAAADNGPDAAQAAEGGGGG